MVLKAKSEADPLAGRRAGSQEEKQKTQGSDRGNSEDLAGKRGFLPSSEPPREQRTASGHCGLGLPDHVTPSSSPSRSSPS